MFFVAKEKNEKKKNWLTLESCSGCLVDGFDVVGRYHSDPSGAEYCAHHPSFVDGFAIDDDVTISERHFVLVIRFVVVHGPERTL